MTYKFTPLQREVFLHYEGGEFAYLLEEPDALDRAGDGLFRFAVMEAGDAETVEELRSMLHRAAAQLFDLAGEIE